MQVKRRERVAIQRDGAGCELHLQGCNARIACVDDRAAGEDDRTHGGVGGIDRHGHAGLRAGRRTELTAGQEHRGSVTLHIYLRTGSAASGDRQEADLRIPAVRNEEGHVVVVRAVAVHAHGDDDLYEQVVELALEIPGEQALELREQHAAAAKGISGDDIEHLIEQCAALELVDAGLHPCGVVAVVLAGEIALVDPVGEVEQVVALGDRDGRHVVNDLVDVRDDLRDRPCVVRQELTEEGLDEAARDRLEHVGRKAVRAAVFREIVDRLGRAGQRVGVVDGAEVRAHAGGDDRRVRAAAKLHEAQRRRIGQAGAGLDVIDGVAGVRGLGGNVDRVHMAGEHDAHAGVGILL